MKKFPGTQKHGGDAPPQSKAASGTGSASGATALGTRRRSSSSTVTGADRGELSAAGQLATKGPSKSTGPSPFLSVETAARCSGFTSSSLEATSTSSHQTQSRKSTPGKQPALTSPVTSAFARVSHMHTLEDSPPLSIKHGPDRRNTSAPSVHGLMVDPALPGPAPRSRAPSILLAPLPARPSPKASHTPTPPLNFSTGGTEVLPALTSASATAAAAAPQFGKEASPVGGSAPIAVSACPAASATSISSTNASVGRRPMSLLERRSGRERNAMSISCLSTLIVETIQDCNAEVVPAGAQPPAPILRGWSRTVTSVRAPYWSGRKSSDDVKMSPVNQASGLLPRSESTYSLIVSPRDAAPSAATPLTGPSSAPDGGSVPTSATAGRRRVSLSLLSACRGAVKVASYNLLAHRLVTTDRYPSCPATALGEDYRAQLMKKEIEYVRPDILALAEMSVDMFEKPNLLGAFLRESMNYAGDHLVITDQQGRPRCGPATAAAVLPVPPPPSRASFAAAAAASVVAAPVPTPASSLGMPQSTSRSPSGPCGVCRAASRDLSASAVVPAPPTSAPSQRSRPSSFPCSGRRASCRDGPFPGLSDGPAIPACTMAESHQEGTTRRTEMEGVAIFYDKSRFELLESVPVRFNEVARQDLGLTPYERKKLQVDSHNVALVSVLRDRQFPTLVYIVAAVHFIWQRVEAQLWQGRVLMERMYALKATYDPQWRDGEQTRPPSCVDTPIKPENGGPSSAERYRLPAVFRRESIVSPKAAGRAAEGADQQAHAVCVVAGDLNAERTSAAVCYLCEGYVPSGASVMSYWRPDGLPGNDGGAGDDELASALYGGSAVFDPASSSALTTVARIRRRSSPSDERLFRESIFAHTGSFASRDSPTGLGAKRSLAASANEDGGLAMSPFAQNEQPYRRYEAAPPQRKRTAARPAELMVPGGVPAEDCAAASRMSHQRQSCSGAPLLVDYTHVSGTDVAGRNLTRSAQQRLSDLVSPTCEHSGGPPAMSESTGEVAPPMLMLYDYADMDPDGMPPPAPRPRRKKRAPSPNAAVADGVQPGQGVSPPGSDAAAAEVPLGLCASSPRKSAKRRAGPPTLLVFEAKDSARMAGAASGRSGRSGDALQESPAASAEGSVLSIGLDAYESAADEQNALFTPDSLGSIFKAGHTRTARSPFGRDDVDVGFSGGALSTERSPNSTRSTEQAPDVPDEEACDFGRPDTACPDFDPSALAATHPHSGPPGRPGGPCDLGSPRCSDAPAVTHDLRLHNAYDVYCRTHPGRVSAVNPSTNQEGKVLDHVLYEREHVVCAAVLRLGELMELPTRNIPSDHYMVGVLLVPRVALPPPTAAVGSALPLSPTTP